MSRVLLLAAFYLGACVGNDSVAFPEGLEPLEDNRAGEPGIGELVTESGKDRPSWGHGRARYAAPPSEVWQVLQGDAVINTWATDEQDVRSVDCEYEHCFLVRYTVNDFVTVEWDEEFRYGGIIEDKGELQLGMVRYQKVWGSEFIDLIEGSYQVLAVDADTTEVQMVQHVQALSGGHEEIVNTFQKVHENLLHALAAERQAMASVKAIAQTSAVASGE